MPKIPAFLFPMALLALLAAPAAWAASLSAEVDRREIGENETLRLTLRLDEQVGFGGPDFDALEQDFEILSQGRSSQMRSINGQSESFTEWNLTLAPKRTGQLTIPSVQFRGAASNAVTVDVEAPADDSSERAEVFVEAETDKERVHVQEQLLLTLRVHTGVRLLDANMEDELEVENAVVEPVAETAYNREIDGRLYRVMEMSYAIFPQRSGSLEIPSLRWDLVMATERGSGLRYRFQAPGRVQRVRSESLDIPVEGKPGDVGEHWLPAEAVSLEERWSNDPEEATVGEPLTRTVTLTARGQTSAQLPPLPEPDVEGLRLYQDQPQLDESNDASGFEGERVESVAVVPTRAGELTLPEMQVSWWDTEADRQRVATLPARQLQVAPAPGRGDQTRVDEGDDTGSTTADTSDGNADSPLWPWLISNGVFAGLALAFLLAWLRERGPRPVAARPGQEEASRQTRAAYNRVRRACAAHDPARCRRALGEWARLYWQLPHRASLKEIAGRCDSTVLRQELEALDKMLYGYRSPPESWRGDKLWRALVKFKRRDLQRHREQSNNESLPPLYPDQSA